MKDRKEKKTPFSRNSEPVPVLKIKPGPWQSRKRFDPVKLQKLQNNIKRDGVLQAIGVKPTRDGNYQIVWGQRRWMCSKALGLPNIPAVILPDSVNPRHAAIAENYFREDLAAVDVGGAFQDFLKDKGATVAELMDWSGCSVTHINGQLELTKLPDSIKEMNRDGRLGAQVCGILLRRCRGEKHMLAVIAGIGDSEGGTSKIRAKALERYLDREGEEPRGPGGTKLGKKRVARQGAGDINLAAMDLADLMEKWLGSQGTAVTLERFKRVWNGLSEIQRKDLNRCLRVITERVRALNEFGRQRSAEKKS